ncbi:MAG TPA: DedA family protein [Candidatus Acidoferrales bacterium]|nr:DedA family protein [Candidatus Acidoferrales bacterium]
MSGIVETITTFTIHIIRQFGYYGVFIGMTIESVGIPLPSEVIMPFAGYVAWTGRLTLVGATLAGTFGCLAGSLIAYAVGLYGGRPLLEHYGKYLLMRKKDMDRAHEWFERHGELAVFASRMLPFVRAFISYPAGIAEMDIKKFSVYSFLGSLVWCFVLTYVGFILGRNWHAVEGTFRYLDIAVVFVAMGMLAYAIYHREKIMSRLRS